MNTSSKKWSIDLHGLLRGALTWVLTALILLLISSAIISAADMKASSFGYFSSLVSFLAAFAGGYASSRGKTDFIWLTSMLFGVVMTVLLLMLGFLVAGEKLSSDGVISVAAFTLSGALLGSFLSTLGKGRRKHRVFQGGKRRKG